MAPRVFRRAAAATTSDTAPGTGSRTASCAARCVYTVVVVAVLLALGLPFLRVQFGGIDERVLPAGTESRVVAETIDRDFPRDVGSPIEAIVTLPDAGRLRRPAGAGAAGRTSTRSADGAGRGRRRR